MLLSSGAIFTVKNPCENSGTPEPATSPVIPHFPHPPNFRGHNSEKCGTGLELFNDFRWERMRSNIEMLRRPKAGWDVVWDAAGTGRGIFQHPPREASGIKRNSTEQIFDTWNRNPALEKSQKNCFYYSPHDYLGISGGGMGFNKLQKIDMDKKLLRIKHRYREALFPFHHQIPLI